MGFQIDKMCTDYYHSNEDVPEEQPKHIVMEKSGLLADLSSGIDFYKILSPSTSISTTIGGLKIKNRKKCKSRFKTHH